MQVLHPHWKRIFPVLLLPFLLASCAWKVTPPSQVSEPVAVYLTEYGKHTRLAIPAPDQGWIEYGFGDWQYYGLEQDDLGSGLRAISGFGTAARSRRKLPPSASAQQFLHAADGIRTAEIQVERARVEILRADLENHWREIQDHSVRRHWDGIQVAPSPTENYHLFHNSNHATGRWLRRLDCKISGHPILSNFRIAPQQNAGIKVSGSTSNQN